MFLSRLTAGAPCFIAQHPRERQVVSPAEGDDPDGWRDAAIFGRIEADISRDAAMQAARKSGKRKLPRLPRRVMTALERDVDVFTAQVRSQYSALMKKRALPTKRLIQSLIGRKLPPYPRRAGRPQKPEITEATKLRKDRKSVV